MENERDKRDEVSDDEKTVELMRKKVDIFSKQGTAVHVTLRNRKFYNGKILKTITQDYFMIEDRVLGQLPVFFMQMFDVEPNEVKKE